MVNLAPSRTGEIVGGLFLVILGDLLLIPTLFGLNALIAMHWPSFDLLFIPAFNTGVLGWVWVVPVVLWQRRQRPLLVRVMIFTSAILTLLDAACFGLIFYGGMLYSRPLGR